MARLTLHRCGGCRARYLGLSALPTRRCPECGGRLVEVWMPEVPRAEPGSYPAGEHAYASMEDFVRADPARLASRERDFGVLWRDGPELSYRAAWIEDTGELYVVQAGRPSRGGGHVEVLGVTDRAGVEAALEGWRERAREHAPIGWLRRRARRLPKRPRVPMRRVGAVALGATLIALAGPAAAEPPRAGATVASVEAQPAPTASTSGCTRGRIGRLSTM